MNERLDADEVVDLVGRLGGVAPLPDDVVREARATLRAAIAQEGPASTGSEVGIPWGAGPAPRGRTRRRRRAATALGVAAAATIALVVASNVGSGVPAPSNPAATRPPAVDRPLAQLADYIQAKAVPPTGDATLVLRTQSYPDRSSMTGADLYTDSGEYFYAATESGLPAQIAANNNQGDGVSAREVKAAEDAASGNVATAAHEMATAPFPGGVRPASDAAGASKLAASKALAAKVAAAEAAGKPVPTTVRTGPTAASTPSRAQIDNYIWIDSLDALSAGAGNPQVRIGVLRILATLPEVTVTNTTTNGKPTVTLTAEAPALPTNYQEALTIDASTGVPVAFAGGAPGQRPSVTVTYQVLRVTVADIAAGKF